MGHTWRTGHVARRWRFTVEDCCDWSKVGGVLPAQSDSERIATVGHLWSHLVTSCRFLLLICSVSGEYEQRLKDLWLL